MLLSWTSFKEPKSQKESLYDREKKRKKKRLCESRLTHPLEVASVAKEPGKAVEKFLVKEKGIRVEDISGILMCGGLLHDIGNPPFDHFEGNRDRRLVLGEGFKKGLFTLDELLLLQKKNGENTRNFYQRNRGRKRKVISQDC